MTRLRFFAIALINYLLSGFFTLLSATTAKNKPNILFIMADDCTYNEIGCYGGKNANTPNIDNLASQGLLFNRAYVGMSMSVPCRNELYTGLYPMESGCAWNHSQSKPGTKSVFHYLGELGYRVGIAGKKHIQPRESFPYINVPGFEENCVLSKEKKEDIRGIEKFMTENNEEPFCLFVCSTSPHAPWTMGDPAEYPPESLDLPATLGDTPEVREAYSRYLAEVTYFDRQVGKVLKTLEVNGIAENTIVILSTEQGWQFSGGKWTNWDIGVHTGLIVRWPKIIPANTKTDALVQFADITPTLIDIAGGKKIRSLSGKSFLKVLTEGKQKHRKYVYCMHNNTPEGTPYPIRTIISEKYHFIMNLLPGIDYFEKHLEAGAHKEVWWQSWKEAAKSNERERLLVNRFYKRPYEELYLIKSDVNQFNNLADDKDHLKEKRKLKKELLKWMKNQNDPGLRVDNSRFFKNRFFDG